jgi:HPt (histidine-containing phosphotransfer) domain-containing protein
MMDSAPDDPIDLSRLEEFTGGDPEQFRELTDLYLSQAMEQVPRLRQAVASGAPREVEQLAHKLAGSSSTCGMVRISPPLRSMEEKARSGSMDGMADLLARVEAELERIRVRVAELQSGFGPRG